MGKLAGRFVGERFSLDDGTYAVFKRISGGRHTQYQVFLESSQSEHSGHADVENHTSATSAEMELFS